MADIQDLMNQHAELQEKFQAVQQRYYQLSADRHRAENELIQTRKALESVELEIRTAKARLEGE